MTVHACYTNAVLEGSTTAAVAELETAVEAAADTISDHCSCVLVFRQPQQCPITFLAATADADSVYSDEFRAVSNNSSSSSSSSSASSSSSSRRKGSGKGKASGSKQQQQQQLEDAECDTTAATAAVFTSGSDDLLTDDTSAVDVAAVLRLSGFQVSRHLITALSTQF
jgi:hypothetical protein